MRKIDPNHLETDRTSRMTPVEKVTLAGAAVILLLISVAVKKIMDNVQDKQKDDLAAEEIVKTPLQEVPKPSTSIVQEVVWYEDGQGLSLEGNFEQYPDIHRACKFLTDRLQTAINTHAVVQGAVDIFHGYDETEKKPEDDYEESKMPFDIGDIESVLGNCSFSKEEIQAMVKDILSQGVKEGDTHLGSQLHSVTKLDCLGKSLEWLNKCTDLPEGDEKETCLQDYVDAGPLILKEEADCYAAKIRSMDLDPAEVQLLHNITGANKLVQSFDEIVSGDISDEYIKTAISMFFEQLAMAQLDFTNERILLHLGVKSKAEFVQFYIEYLEKLMDNCLVLSGKNIRSWPVGFRYDRNKKTIGQFIAEFKSN